MEQLLKEVEAKVPDALKVKKLTGRTPKYTDDLTQKIVYAEAKAAVKAAEEAEKERLRKAKREAKEKAGEAKEKADREAREQARLKRQIEIERKKLEKLKIEEEKDQKNKLYTQLKDFLDLFDERMIVKKFSLQQLEKMLETYRADDRVPVIREIRTFTGHTTRTFPSTSKLEDIQEFLADVKETQEKRNRVRKVREDKAALTTEEGVEMFAKPNDMRRSFLLNIPENEEIEVYTRKQRDKIDKIDTILVLWKEGNTMKTVSVPNDDFNMLLIESGKIELLG